jgi:hypothetical protein
MRCITCTILCAFYLNGHSQVFENGHPDNVAYKNIVVANFPIVSQNKRGTIFYSFNNSPVDNSIKVKVRDWYQEFSQQLEYYRFRGNRYRYLYYKFRIDTFFYSQPTPNRVADSIVGGVYASRFRLKWSWRKFRKVLRFIDTVKMYSFVVKGSFNFVETKHYEKGISLNPLSVAYHFQNELTGQHISEEADSLRPFLELDLNDNVVQTHNLETFIDLSKIYLRYRKEKNEWLLYLNLLYKI